jgi:hypothetical protein
VQRDGGQGQAGDAVATESEGKGKQTPPLRRKWGLGYEKPLSCAWSERGKWRHELTASCHGKKKNTVWLALGAREGNGTPLARVRGESEDGDKGNKHPRLKRGVARVASSQIT